MKIEGAILYVKDLAGMADFYERVLGMKVRKDTRGEHWVELGEGGMSLGLHAIPAHIAETISITSPPAAREETPIKLIFAVTDLAGENMRLLGLGVSLQERPWGVWDGVDPEGNIFQLRQNLGQSLGQSTE